MKVVVTGGSGLVGQEVTAALVDQGHDVLFTFTSRQVEIENAKGVSLDITDAAAVQACIKGHNPSFVVHLAAEPNQGVCEKDPGRAQAVNVEGTRNVAKAAAAINPRILLVVFSSDMVYDGAGAPYDEATAVLNPLSVYGKSKAEAETAARGAHANTVVVRLALTISPRGIPPLNGGRTPECFLQLVTKMIQNREELKLFTDEFRPMVSAYDIARTMQALAAKQAAALEQDPDQSAASASPAAAAGYLALVPQVPAVLHVAGPERLSRLDFGRMVADALLDGGALTPAEHTDVTTTVLLGSRVQDANLGMPRPPDTMMDTGRMAALGVAPTPLGKVLRSMLESDGAVEKQVKKGHACTLYPI